MRRLVATPAMLAIIWCLGGLNQPEWQQRILLPTLVSFGFILVGLASGQLIFAALQDRRWVSASMRFVAAATIVWLIAESRVVQVIALGRGLMFGGVALVAMGAVPLQALLNRRVNALTMSANR